MPSAYRAPAGYDNWAFLTELKGLDLGDFDPAREADYHSLRWGAPMPPKVVTLPPRTGNGHRKPTKPATAVPAQTAEEVLREVPKPDESVQDAGVKFRRMGLDPCRDRFSVRWKFSPAELPELRREIEENHLTLVILDSLFRIFGGYGQEITAPETALWLYQLNRIASDTGAAIVMAHHLTKPSAGAKRTRTEVTSYDLFGSSYLFNATGDCWGLYRSPREGADQEFCIRCLKSRSGIVTTGTTYDLQGSEEDYSWIHAGITGSTESLTDRLKGRELVAEFLRSRGKALAAEEVASALHIARRVAQKHLMRLVDERLVVREKGASSGGRASWRYRAVPLTRT
jgi:hypothetical protein